MTAKGRPVSIARRYRGLALDRRAVERAVHVLDAHREAFLGGCPDGELSVVFLSDRALAALHDRFLGDPSITDVITFEGAEPGVLAGEICVSVDAAVRVAGRRAGALSRELALYLVHGWLHLSGYDDLVPSKKRAMRRAEARALAILEREGALPRFGLA
jgi:probable rRNA maturation factor